MLGCTYHVESIHSNYVISRNHWPALTVLGDKTNLISQIWSLFSADPIYRNWPTKTMPAAKLLNSLPRRKHAMIVSHNINLIVPLISCVTLLLNLVAQIWKINLKYPGSPQPTYRHSDCETKTNRQKEYRFRLPRAWAIISESVRGEVTLCNSQGGCWHRWRDSSKLTELGASGYSTRVIMVRFVNFALEWWR